MDRINLILKSAGLVLTICALTVLLSLLYGETAGRLILHILIVAGTVATGYMLYKLGKIRLERARRESEIMIISQNGQTVINDKNPNATWFNPGLMIKPTWTPGTNSVPTDIEFQAWQIRQKVNLINTGIQAFSNHHQTDPRDNHQNPDLSMVEPISGITRQHQSNNKPNIFDMITDAQRLYIHGGSGTGKTTFLNSLIRQFRNKPNHEIYVIDPHAAPDDWPEAAEIVGRGRNYNAVSMFAEYLKTQLDERYQMRTHGIKDFPVFWLFIDELSLLIDQVEGFAAAYQQVLKEGRKINLNLCLSGHSTRAGELGMKGRYDLMKNFDSVIETKKNNGQFSAVLDTGDNQIECHVPLIQIPWNSSSHGSHSHGHGHAVTSMTTGMTASHGISHGHGHSHGHSHGFKSDTDKKICELYETMKADDPNDSVSLSEIARCVFGYSNGTKVKNVSVILNEYGYLNN